MSSEITQILPATSPMTLVTWAWLCAGRSFVSTASSPPSISANFFASLTRPVSAR